MKRTSEDVCVRMKNDLKFFSFLDEDDMTNLAPYFECAKVDAGETLWKEGDPCDFEAFIMSGRLEVKKETEFQGKQVIVGVYKEGTLVGDLCILDGRPKSVTAVAVEDANLLLLSRDSFEKLLTEHPLAAAKLLKGMLLAVSTRLRKAYERLTSIF